MRRADGADAVSAQLQGADNTPASMRAAAAIQASPATYLTLTKQAVTAIRKASKRVPIWDGIATDAGGVPANPANMITDYHETYALVQGYWINLNQWNRGPANGCERTGCGAIGREFLTGIGVPS